MPANFKTRMNLGGSPFAWVGEIVEGTNEAVNLLWRFDALQSSSIDLIKSAEESKAEREEVEIAGKTKVTYPKFELVLDGLTGEDITPTASSGDTTGKATIKMSVVVSPVEKTTMGAFLKELKEKKDSKFIVVLGGGLGYENLTDANKAYPQEWYLMAGRLDPNVSLEQSNSPIKVDLTFNSCTTSLTEQTLTGVDFTDITWNRGGTGKDRTITFPTITSAVASLIKAGDCAIITNVV